MHVNHLVRIWQMYLRLVFLVCILVLSVHAAGGENPAAEPQWKQVTAEGVVVDLWFFWSATCPHCEEAQPHIRRMAQELPWVRLHSFRLDGHPENIATYRWLANAIGQDARSVPAFVFCARMLVGWDGGGVIEKSVRDGLLSCRKQTVQQDAGRAQPIVLPVFGEIDPQEWSLPAFTVAIAVLDSFNPCAFFVLLFLLSLLVHAGSRRRMLAIGGLFILVSGVVYFAAMAAWLSLFKLVGNLPLVTLAAGSIAVAIALFNIKDYFWFKQGISLSISRTNRGRLMQRARNLVSSGSMPAMIAATLSLAVVANLYELLCTAGFPMVYTRLLTLNNLGTAEYYSYLLAYNAVYILPLLLILGVFVATLGQRKLQEHEGRVLKLLSGLMMLALGALLVFIPGALDRLWVAAAVLLGAAAVTWVVVQFSRPR